MVSSEEERLKEEFIGEIGSIVASFLDEPWDTSKIETAAQEIGLDLTEPNPYYDEDLRSESLRLNTRPSAFVPPTLISASIDLTRNIVKSTNQPSSADLVVWIGRGRSIKSLFIARYPEIDPRSRDDQTDATADELRKIRNVLNRLFGDTIDK